MHNDPNIDRSPPDEATIARGYEARDVNVRVLIALLLGFIVTMSILGSGLWWFYKNEVRRSASGEPRSAVQVDVRTNAPPLQPQEGHEAIDAWDLRKMREQEDATFADLGWKRDEKAHRFAVPVEVIEQVKQRTATTRPAGGGR